MRYQSAHKNKTDKDCLDKFGGTGTNFSGQNPATMRSNSIGGKTQHQIAE